MPLFISTLLGALISATGSIVGRVLISLGVSSVTYTGLSASIDWLKTQAVTAAGGLGADVLGMLSTMKVGTCISIIFSAMSARLLINGMSGDAFKKWVIK